MSGLVLSDPLGLDSHRMSGWSWAINVPGDFRASTNIGAMQTKALPISTPPTLNAKSCKEA